MNIEITNLYMKTQDKQYRILIPADCIEFNIQCRDGTAFRLSTKEGKVADSSEPYWSVKAAVSSGENSQIFRLKNLKLKKDMLLYVACGSAAKTLEITMVKDGDLNAGSYS